MIDRVPDELWTEVHDIVQETGMKTIPKKKKWRKTIKWEILDRDLFKKIRDNKGTFHAKKGSIKDRNGMDLCFKCVYSS